MKINHLNTPPGTGPAHQRGEAQKAQAGKAAAPSPAAQADVSHIRQQNIDTGHDIDTARVEEVRTAIREGRLEIHAERIAEGLLANLGK